MPLYLSGSSGVSGVDGSNTTPAIQGSDTNTGMVFPVADTIAFVEGGAEVMRINSSGNVGIGNTAPTAKLHVQGAILASDNITAYSDERLKKDITTIENALEKVSKIRGVRYIQTNTCNPGIGLVALRSSISYTRGRCAEW